mgnify:FL=1
MGLALAFTIGSITNFGLLYMVLRQQSSIFKSEQSNLLKFVGKVILATVIMALVIQLSKNIFGSIVDMQRFWGVTIKTLGSIIIGVSVYIGICHLLKCEEINEVKNILVKKFGLNGVGKNGNQ